jgi:hypothetical protein
MQREANSEERSRHMSSHVFLCLALQRQENTNNWRFSLKSNLTTYQNRSVTVLACTIGSALVLRLSP